jgi:hypothetical protein
MNELDPSCEQDRYELLGILSQKSKPKELSCEQDGCELCGARIQVHCSTKFPIKSSFTSGNKLEISEESD